MAKTKTKACMLTTVDNPFDPFEDFDSWYLFDMDKGYNSCSYLARIANYTSDQSVYEEDIETERAIDEIVLNDVCNLYKKVSKQVESIYFDDDEAKLYE